MKIEKIIIEKLDEKKGVYANAKTLVDLYHKYNIENKQEGYFYIICGEYKHGVIILNKEMSIDEIVEEFYYYSLYLNHKKSNR